MSEILPNLSPSSPSSFLFTTIYAIGTYVGLGFLTVVDAGDRTTTGARCCSTPPRAQAVESGHVVVVHPAGPCIALLGTSLALINFGIDEFINPRLRAAGCRARRPRRAGGRSAPQLGFTPVVRKQSAARRVSGRRAPAQRWTDDQPRIMRPRRGRRRACGPRTRTIVAGDPRLSASTTASAERRARRRRRRPDDPPRRGGRARRRERQRQVHPRLRRDAVAARPWCDHGRRGDFYDCPAGSYEHWIRRGRPKVVDLLTDDSGGHAAPCGGRRSPWCSRARCMR